MLPIPTLEGIPSSALFYSDNHEADLLYITLLLKMSSPIKLPIFWANLTNASTILAELEMTNVQPIVLAGVGVEHTKMVRDLCRAAATSPRRLLVVAKDDVALPGEIDAEHMFSLDEIDLAALPWETLGSLVLRAYMRNEWQGLWFTREPVPGNERKVDVRDTA